MKSLVIQSASRTLLLVILMSLPLVSAGAQVVKAPCEPLPDVKKALASLPEGDAVLTFGLLREKRLEVLRRLLVSFPKDLFIHKRFQEVMRSSTLVDWQALIAQYRTLSVENANDSVFLYLYGRLLVARKTPQAETLLKTALERDPNFAWAHLSLADIYRLPRYRDKAKEQKEIRAFFDLCPAPLSSEAYGHLRTADDLDLVREAARALRSRLEVSSNPHELVFYNTLWQLEFRARPVKEHAQVRQQIESDLKRLRQLGLTDDRGWLETLRGGYRLANNSAEKHWAEDEIILRFPHSHTAKNFIIERWQQENPQPEWRGSPDDFQPYYAKLLPATEDWIKRWPDDTSIRYRRFDALLSLKGSQLADVEIAFDALQKALKKDPGTFFSIPPAPIRMAQHYLHRGVKLHRVPDLVRQGFHEFEKQSELEQESDASPPGEINYAQENLNSTYWSGWPTITEAYLKTNQAARAREIVRRMEEQLAKERPAEKAEAEAKSVFQWREAIYWEWAGRLAEAEGRKLDALACYQKAMTVRPQREVSAKKNEPDELTIRAQKLWKSLGGTDDGWAKWSTRETSRVAIASVGGPWEKRNKPLPEFELTDLAGRTWRLADLKGKVTFVNIWATWCGPCQQELPYVQKLYERLKGRQDVLVMSLNIDQDVGLVEPYVKEKKLTFAVLPAQSYVEAMFPSIAIPRSWVVGPDGTLLMEQVGFGFEGEEWLGKVLSIMQEAGAAK